MAKNTFIKPGLFVLIIICGCIISCTTNSYKYKPKYKPQNDQTQTTRSQLVKSQNSSGPEAGMPSVPGKCYAKCLIATVYQNIPIDSIPIYSNIENVEYTVEQIEVEPSETKWVKKKADRNCMSADPNDCLVWCLVEEPAVIKEIKVPHDPSKAGELTYEIIKTKKIIKQGGFTEWREVVCSDKITSDLVRHVHDSLLKAGYDTGTDWTDNVIGKETKAALVNFQRDNDLPVGQLDIETLKVMGISSSSY